MTRPEGARCSLAVNAELARLTVDLVLLDLREVVGDVVDDE
jgi:hypothetical protein